MLVQYSGLEIFIMLNGKTYLAADLGVEEMKVTDSDEGDNEIELTIPDNDYKITDGGVFKTGQLMSIQWGYIGGDTSTQRSNYVIMKPATTYGEEGCVAKVTASTKSATLAARRPRKVYGPTSVKTVISEIAKRNNLTLNITDGNERMAGWAHGAWSDREVVRVLADRFGYQATYTSETLTFTKRDYGAVPQVELVYNRQEGGNIISASLEVDAKKSKGDALTTAVSVDPASKKVVQGTSNPAPKTLAISAEDGNSWLTNVSQAAQTAVSKIPGASLVSDFGKNFAPTPEALPPDIQSIISSPDPSPNNLTSLASGELQAKQKKKGELKITSIGICRATSRMIVSVKGLAKRDSGNFYCVEVVHNISIDKGYVCEWELGRHGNNTKGSEKNTQPLNNQKPINTKTSVKNAIAISGETGQRLP